MIYGIGTDLVVIERMAALLARHPDAAARRILAPAEQAGFAASADPARFLAKRFAVKEAFGKALGTGVRAPALLTAVAVGHDELGKPQLQFDAPLSDYLASCAIVRHHVSISDERGHALAFVVLEAEDARANERT